MKEKNKMKLDCSLTLIATATLAVVQTGRADDALSLPQTNDVPASSSLAKNYQLDGSLFPANEVSADAFGTLSTGQDALSHLSAERYRHDSHGGFGLGLNYFFLRYVGVGGEAYSENTDGRFIDKSSANLILRLPSDRFHLAPYVFTGAGYQFEPEERAFGQAGLGVEYRPVKHVGLFVDDRFVFPDAYPNYALARAGVRFSF